MDNKEKLNKTEDNEEFIIPEFEDYQSKKKPDVDEVIKKLNERITALEAEENTFEEIKKILEKHNFKYLCDPDLNAVEIMFDERPFRVQIILNEYRLELKLIFPFAAQSAALAVIALFMMNFNKDKAFASMHLNPDNGEMSMKYSYFISKTAGLDEDDFWLFGCKYSSKYCIEVSPFEYFSCANLIYSSCFLPSFEDKKSFASCIVIPFCT